MKLNINQLIILIIIYSNFCLSQEIKTYNGDFKGGTAKFSYFETENLQRIYDGKFEYYSEQYISKGRYLNNKRDSTWTFKYISRNKYAISLGNGYLKYEARGNYIDNFKNGKWTITCYNSYKKTTNINVIEFKNDTIINFSYDTKKLKFSIDSIGNINTVKINYGNKSEALAEFYNGILMKFLKRNIEDGEVYDNFHPNKEKLIEIINNLNNSNYVASTISRYGDDNQLKSYNFKEDDKWLIFERNQSFSESIMDTINTYFTDILLPIQSITADNIKTNNFTINKPKLIYPKS